MSSATDSRTLGFTTRQLHAGLTPDPTNMCGRTPFSLSSFVAPGTNGQPMAAVEGGFDASVRNIYDLTIKLGGTYGGTPIDKTEVSGGVTVYGQSGFGFELENLRIRESGLTIQLFDANGKALSALTYLNITGNCDSNLLIVNYKQVREIQP